MIECESFQGVQKMKLSWRRSSMAFLFSYGLLSIISIVVGFIFTILGLFLGHIILFDSIVLSVISGILCHQLVGIHSAISLAIGAVLFVLLLWLQRTKVGFWIIGVLLSVWWALVFGMVAYIFTSSDVIWFYVVMGLGFVVVMRLHLIARNSHSAC
jgi:hypothetical protein